MFQNLGEVIKCHQGESWMCNGEHIIVWNLLKDQDFVEFPSLCDSSFFEVSDFFLLWSDLLFIISPNSLRFNLSFPV